MGWMCLAGLLLFLAQYVEGFDPKLLFPSLIIVFCGFVASATAFWIQYTNNNGIHLDAHGLPLALRTESASPAEVKLVTAALEARIVADVSERMIGDKAYDSDRLDEQLMQGVWHGDDRAQQGQPSHAQDQLCIALANRRKCSLQSLLAQTTSASNLSTDETTAVGFR